LAAGAARKAREKLTDPRRLPFEAICRLSFYLAIKLSILQESLPTVFTANWPKDTAFLKILRYFRFGPPFGVVNQANLQTLVRLLPGPHALNQGL